MGKGRLAVFGSVLVASRVLLGCSAGAEPVGHAAQADHAWGNLHWARTSNPFTLKLGDNVSSAWDAYLATTSSDWSQSNVIDTTIVNGQANPRNCRPTSGRIEVCNATYGNNGWLGVAQVWTTGGHIAAATTKLNDTYFTMAKYNTPAWRNLVMCQEVGHTFGLHHQDEIFSNANLGSCMDYTNNPESNQHPNAHDYAQLESIYAHADSTTTAGSLLPFAPDDDGSPAQWGELRRVSPDGRTETYHRAFDGFEVFTFVVKAE